MTIGKVSQIAYNIIYQTTHLLYIYYKENLLTP
jgi:hypothetical protein